MIERGHPILPIGAQCRLLLIARSSFDHTPQGETELNLALMRRTNERFLETPFYGVRQMTWHLRNQGHGVNEKRTRRLMRLMRLAPHLPAPQHQQAREGVRSPALPPPGPASGSVQPEQVARASPDRPMRRGFLYLVTVMGWATRMVLACRLSNTPEADFCVEVLTEARSRFGVPGIMNTDHGSQVTSFAWTSRLTQVGVRMVMDGRGRCIINLSIERPWRFLQCQCVCLQAWKTSFQTRVGAALWMSLHNHHRSDSAHVGTRPAMGYQSAT